MTRHKINSNQTDRAWNLLSARLQQDGLIPAETKKNSFPLPGWAVAAVLIFCAAGAATLAFLQKNEPDADVQLFTLHNEKGSATLATTLEDGSIVYLADDTQLCYPEHFATGKREVTLRGRALFDVQGNRECPFLIRTETAQIEVTGTVFNVQHTDAIPFKLSVSRGEVKVTLAENGRCRYAGAGETVTLTPSGQLHTEKTTGAEPFDPYSGHIRFKDEKLANILRVINQRSGGEVILQTTPALGNRKITATFTDATPENVAELLCAAFNLLCKKENTVLLITEP
jgi:ferric-dicitrate binding protein FerR (iron transport regulator)